MIARMGCRRVSASSPLKFVPLLLLSALLLATWAAPELAHGKEIPPTLPQHAQYMVFDNGRWEMVAYSTLLGFATGIELGIVASGSQDNRVAGGLLLGTGVGLGWSLLGTRDGYVSTGRVGLFRLFTEWGNITGLELTAFADLHEDAVAGNGAAGGLLGALAWWRLTQESTITSGQAALLSSSYIWGSFLGFLTSIMVLPEDSDESDDLRDRRITIGLAAGIGNFSLLIASRFAPSIRISRRRVSWLDLGATVGSLAGFGAGMLLTDRDAAIAALAAGGMASGTWVAYSVSSDTDNIELPFQRQLSMSNPHPSTLAGGTRANRWLIPLARLTW